MDARGNTAKSQRKADKANLLRARKARTNAGKGRKVRRIVRHPCNSKSDWKGRRNSAALNWRKTRRRKNGPWWQRPSRHKRKSCSFSCCFVLTKLQESLKDWKIHIQNNIYDTPTQSRLSNLYTWYSLKYCVQTKLVFTAPIYIPHELNYHID